MMFASWVGRVGMLVVALGVETATSDAPGVTWGAPDDAGRVPRRLIRPRSPLVCRHRGSR
jgi:hypothetical protein